MDFPVEEEKRVVNFLRQQNCCLSCCFRFIGCRVSQDPLESAKRLGYNIEDTVGTDEAPCVSCLGILQDQIQESVVQRIQEEVEKHNYDCETFTCALTVPPCLSLRERLLHVLCAAELDFTEDMLLNLKAKTQSVKDTWKWVVSPKIEQAIKKKLDLTPSTFLIEIILKYKYNEEECEALIHMEENNATNKRKRKFNNNRFSRKKMETVMTKMTDKEFSQCFNTLLLKTGVCVEVESIVCSHSSIFVGGRYNKLSRELSQTPWFINGEKKMESSVQDILCNPIVEVVGSQSIKFLSSGREDVDVRNIYSGRPFAVELINPQMTKLTEKLLSDLTEKINQSSKQVQVTSALKVLSRFDLKKLKEGENVKTKFYRALCVCRNKSTDMLPLEELNNLKRIKIVQKTPVRVLHRRPLAPRTRLIYEMRARWAKACELKELLNTAGEDPETFFVLDIKTQAGTYVKEFVHGDFGRTKPSLCDILKTEVDIVALDVTGINLDWP